MKFNLPFIAIGATLAINIFSIGEISKRNMANCEGIFESQRTN
jgi:hypothetical protein